MVKILLTGASGLLGREVMKEAQKRGFEIVGLALKRAGGDLVRCDLTLPHEVKDVVEKVKPDIIIHSAAERFPDKVEKEYEKVKSLNISATGVLAEAAKNLKIKFIYISTDYVFDGTSPPYKESNEPNPLNKYGHTKLAGERLALSHYPECSILRIPVLYGDVEYLGESAVTTLLTSIKSSSVQPLSHREKRYPSSTADIARILCDLIPLLMEDSANGIFHWSGKEVMTKYEMAVTIAKAFSLPHDHLKPEAEAASSSTNRPLDARLDNSKLESLSISHHTPFEEGIKRALSKWV